MMKPTVWMVVTSKDAWTKWLDENHRKQKEVWLKINRSHNTSPGIRLEDAVTEAIRFGWIDSRMYSIDDYNYVLRFSPRRKNSIWSAKNRTRAESLLREGKMSEAGVKTIETAKKNGRWDQAYTSDDPPEISQEFEKRLKEEHLYESFLSLAASHRTRYLFWINEAKYPVTKKRRIETVIGKLLSIKKGN